jgi:hypothetical protein
MIFEVSKNYPLIFLRLYAKYCCWILLNERSPAHVTVTTETVYEKIVKLLKYEYTENLSYDDFYF